MTVLHGPPETPRQARPRSAPLCPECLAPFAPVHPQQLFCCVGHKTAHNNRMTVRGRQLTAFSLASRITRGGSRRDTATGKRARQDSSALMDKWIAEDRAAGRMPPDDYLRLRYLKGFDRP